MPSEQGNWHTSTPLLILIGAADDWTPAAPCERLAAAADKAGEPVTYQAYPRAYHDFDHPQLKLRFTTALPIAAMAAAPLTPAPTRPPEPMPPRECLLFSPAEAVRADENEDQAASSLHPAPLTSKTDPLQRIRIKSWAGRHDAIILPPSRGLFA